MSVNDDAIALKGAKGPHADKDPNNGGNANIIIEDCVFGFCHSAVTCGSESLHNRNIVFRNSTVTDAQRLLWLKMRPDTPQNYEYITVDNIKGNARNFIYIKPWTQFFDLKGEKDIRRSAAGHIRMSNIQFECTELFNIDKSDQYSLNAFSFENLDIQAKSKLTISKEQIPGLKIRNVKINGKNM